MTSNEPPPYPGDGPTHDLPAYGSVPPPEGYQPPPGSAPPPAPAEGGGSYEATAAFGYGWRAFKSSASTLVLATLLVVAVAAVLSFASEAIAPSPDMMGADGGFEFQGGALLGSFVAQTITGGIAFLATAMFVRGTLDITEGRPFSIGSAFSRIPVVPVIITGILISLLTTIGFLLLFLPGVIFAIFSFFTIYFVVDRDESPLKAIGSSFSMVGSHLGAALLSGLLAVLVLMAGTIALIVGLLVAIPVTALAAAYAFRKFSGQQVVEIA